MRKYFLLLFVLIALVNIAESKSLTLISGITLDSASKKPITGVEISIIGKDTSISVISDRNGMFSIEVKPGKYTIKAKYLLINVYKDDNISIKAQEHKELDIVFNPSNDRDKQISTVSSDESNLSENQFLIEEISRTSILGNKEKVKEAEPDKIGRMMTRSLTSAISGLAKETPLSTGYITKAIPSSDADPLMPAESYESTDIEAGSAIKTEVASGGSLAKASSAGVLTSGEVNDFRKWDMWNDFAENELKNHAEFWKIKPGKRFTVQVLNRSQLPLVDCFVELLYNNKIIWVAKTDNTGKAELWTNIFPGSHLDNENLSIRVNSNGNSKSINDIKEFKNGINIVQLDEKCNNPNNVDIMFVVDATGSMGDEINYLKAEVTDIIGKLEKKFPAYAFRTGSIFYKDVLDDYLIRKLDLNRDIRITSQFINAQNASGGGDYEEAVEEALLCAVNEVNWSKEAVARICFLILDAPPHNNPVVLEKIREISAVAAMKGIRIIPVVCSGVDKKTEYLMRSLSLITNGTYVFLTDDSGIGNPHIKPTTDKYDVELLNDLFIRLIGQFSSVPDCGKENFLVESEINENIFNKDENRFDDTKDSWVKPLKCYPNPSKGEITIEILSDLDEIFIVDIAGKILQKYERPYKGSESFDLSRYPTGVYFIKYMKENKWGCERVILIR